MNKIFTFIFEILRDLFNFLDFSLPGISLTFMDFLLLVIIIPIIFKLVKGAIGESGDGLLFGAFDITSSSISSYSKLSYSNFAKEKSRKDLYNFKYRHSSSDLIYTNYSNNRKYLNGGVYDGS